MIAAKAVSSALGIDAPPVLIALQTIATNVLPQISARPISGASTAKQSAVGTSVAPTWAITAVRWAADL